MNYKELSDFKFIEFIKKANEHYREGSPIVSDSEYDEILIPELILRDPDNEFLKKVEPSYLDDEKVKLPYLMLSMNKVKNRLDLFSWLFKLKGKLKSLKLTKNDIDNLVFKITPKLDGFGVYYDRDTNRLYTRGDGEYGMDISRVLNRNVGVYNQGHGKSELVVSKIYFDKRLSSNYSNSRNFQSAVIRSKKMSKDVITAIKDNGIIIYPFNELKAVNCKLNSLMKSIEGIKELIYKEIDYDVDGVVIELTDNELREKLSNNNKFYHYQVAYKDDSSEETAIVDRVEWSTTRTGRVNPVVVIEPKYISNVLITRATGANAKNIKKLSIGPGSVVKLIRAGLTIPHITKVIKKSGVIIPEICSSCGYKLIYKEPFLWCNNKGECKSKISDSLNYFLKTIEIGDGFGPATLKVMVDNGVRTIIDIFDLKRQDLINMGFGNKTSDNLLIELNLIKNKPILEYKFLAAFGCDGLNRTMSKNILEVYDIKSIFKHAEKEGMFKSINGISDITENKINRGLMSIKDMYIKTLNIGFNLETLDNINIDKSNKLYGKTILFTGTFNSGTRDDLIQGALKLGAKPVKSVSKKLDYLIRGKDPGNVKIKKAENFNVTILNENMYINNIKNF